MKCSNPKCITNTASPPPATVQGAALCQFCGSAFQPPAKSFVENEGQALWKLKNYKRN